MKPNQVLPSLFSGKPPATADELVAILKAHIKERAMVPHQAFLSQYEIEKKYGVTIHQAKQALERMEEESLIYRVHRRGSFVAPRARNHPILLSAQEGLEEARSPVIAQQAKLVFMQGILDALENDASPHYAILLPSRKFREIRYDLAHVYRHLAGVVVFRDIDLVEVARPVLEELGIPLAFYGSDLHVSRLEGVHRLLYAETEVVTQATDPLLGSGRKRIACAFNPDSAVHAHRRNLFHRRMSEKGLAPCADIPLSLGTAGEERSERELEEALKRRGEFDAVFAVDDSVAIHLLNRLIRRQVKVPEEVAITGVNNYPTSFHAVVPLSTVDIPLRGDAQRLMTELSARIGSPEGKTDPIDLRSRPRLVRRETT